MKVNSLKYVTYIYFISGNCYIKNKELESVLYYNYKNYCNINFRLNNYEFANEFLKSAEYKKMIRYIKYKKLYECEDCAN